MANYCPFFLTITDPNRWIQKERKTKPIEVIDSIPSLVPDLFESKFPYSHIRKEFSFSVNFNLRFVPRYIEV